VQQQHVAGLDHYVVRGHDLLKGLQIDRLPRGPEVVGQVDQHAPALHPVRRHVLQAEVAREAEAEAQPVLDLADPLEHLRRSEQIDTAQLVVLAPVTPGRARRTLLPTLSHGSSSSMPRPWELD
jgi:hypothetical protein